MKEQKMVPARKEPDLSTYSGRFAARLRELREKNKMTAEEVAKKLGVSQQTISTWETGTRQPPFDTIYQMVSVYKIKNMHSIFPKE